MSASKLVGAIIIIAIIVAGLMSHHMRTALQAIHVTHGLWVIGKVAVVALAAGGLLVARVCKALRPADATSRPPSAPDSRSPS